MEAVCLRSSLRSLNCTIKKTKILAWTLPSGHLKNIWFASSPNQLFLWTKKPSEFGSENQKIPILQLLKISKLCQGKNGIYQIPASSPRG